jgi:hypothetical protein
VWRAQGTFSRQIELQERQGTSAPSASDTRRSGGAVIRLGEAEIRGHGHPRSERSSTSPSRAMNVCNAPAAACTAMSCSADCRLRREELLRPAAACAASCSTRPPRRAAPPNRGLRREELARAPVLLLPRVLPPPLFCWTAAPLLASMFSRLDSLCLHSPRRQGRS